MSRSVLALYARGPSGKEVILNEGSMCWHYGRISVCACVRVCPCISTFAKCGANFQAYPLSSVQLLEKQRSTYDSYFPPSFYRCQSQPLRVVKRFSELC